MGWSSWIWFGIVYNKWTRSSRNEIDATTTNDVDCTNNVKGSLGINITGGTTYQLDTVFYGN